MGARTCFFVLFWVLSFLVFKSDLDALIDLSWNDNRYTHIVLIPAVSAGLVFLKRRKVFREAQYDPWSSLPVAALAALLYCFAKGWPEYLGQHGSLSAVAAAIVLVWVAGFVLFYGARCGKAALFPLALLLLAVPIDPAVVEVAEVSLQKGSAEVTHLIFRLTSTPVFREGLVFSLPGLTIEVAEECSGIRSGISLLITALVLGHLFLRSGWSKVCCVLLTVPIAIVKNAVRIATLSMLGVYVSQDYLHGDLHHRGGPLFSILSLVLLLAGLWLFRKAEEGIVNRRRPGAGSTVAMDKGRQTQIRTIG